MVDLVRSLQPNCLVNSRLLLDSRAGSSWPENVGDYDSTGDHGSPASGAQNYCEVPQTMNRCWGYSKFEHNWKSRREVIHQLVDVVSKGGNYLLDLGPTGEGIIPQPAVTLWRKSVFGWDGTVRVFMTLQKVPWGVALATIYNQVRKNLPARFRLATRRDTLACRVEERGEESISASGPQPDAEVRRDLGKLSIQLPGNRLDEDDTVVVLEITGKPEVEPSVVTQKAGSFNMLTAVTAVTTAKALKYFDQSRNGMIRGTVSRGK